MLMFALYLIGTLCLVAFVLWLIERAPFFSASMKPIITWAVIALAGFWVIALFASFFGLWHAPPWFDGPNMRR